MYKFKCPGCNANYIGKTDRSLYTRIKEHSFYDSSEIYNHVISCNEFNFIKNLLELNSIEVWPSAAIYTLIIYMTKLLQSVWLRKVIFFHLVI